MIGLNMHKSHGAFKSLTQKVILRDMATGSDTRPRGRYIDTVQTLAQVGGFIADHAGNDCGDYRDVFTWLEIYQRGATMKPSDIENLGADQRYGVWMAAGAVKGIGKILFSHSDGGIEGMRSNDVDTLTTVA